MIFATEVNPHRRAMAMKMGADEALDPAPGDVVARVIAKPQKARARTCCWK